MANAFSEYTTTGPSDGSGARGAAVADLGVGAACGILLWPFPVMRMLFEGLAGSAAMGWAIHVPALLVFLGFAAWAYVGVCSTVAHRTVGMYFADLGFPERPVAAAALGFAGVWVPAAVAALVGVAGPASRIAKERLASTR